MRGENWILYRERNPDGICKWDKGLSPPWQGLGEDIIYDAKFDESSCGWTSIGGERKKERIVEVCHKDEEATTDAEPVVNDEPTPSAQQPRWTERARHMPDWYGESVPSMWANHCTRNNGQCRCSRMEWSYAEGDKNLFTTTMCGTLLSYPRDTKQLAAGGCLNWNEIPMEITDTKPNW